MTAATLALSGDFNIQHAADVHQKLLSAIGTDGSELDLDISAVEAFDSAAVQLLLACRKTLVARGGRLRVTAAAPNVRAALTTYGLEAALLTPEGDRDVA